MPRTRTLARQDGLAMPVAILVLALAMLLTGALLVSATRGSVGADRDRLVKRAVQAADAGVDVARNQLAAVGGLGALQATDCIATNATTGAAYKGGTATAGWCPVVSGQLADGATYGYQLSTTTPRSIIATGAASSGRETMRRRVAYTLGQEAKPIPYFGPYGISSNESVDLAGDVRLLDDAAGRTQLRTNQSISLGGSAKLGCGLFTPGPGSKVNVNWDAKWCLAENGSTTTSSVQMPVLQSNPPAAFDPATELFQLPAIPAADLAAAKASTDHQRITNCRGQTATGPDDGSADLCPGKEYSGGWSWDPTLRKLDLGGGTSNVLTLRGSLYYFCSLRIGGSATLRIPAGRTVRIYVDRCAGDNSWNAGQFVRDGGAFIDNQSALPERLQVYVNGGGRVDFPSDKVQQLTIYAPDSTVNISGAAKLIGAVAGRKVTVSGSGSVIATAATAQLGAPSGGSTQPPDYKECATARTAAVASGCE